MHSVAQDPAHPSQNKGFAFCVYKTRENAEEALRVLHQAEFADHPGRRVRLLFYALDILSGLTT